MKTKSRNPLKSYLINQQQKISTTFFFFLCISNQLTIKFKFKTIKTLFYLNKKKRNKIKNEPFFLEIDLKKNISIKHYILSAKRESISKKNETFLRIVYNILYSL